MSWRGSGIQSDLKREYITYTRGRQTTMIWLEKQPYGTPGPNPPPAELAHGANAAAARRIELLRGGLRYYLGTQDEPWHALFARAFGNSFFGG